jgi:peptide/nickel transport system substrate-binding protein
MELGERIARRMKELGQTQMEVARAAGLTQQAISQYVRGKFKPGYEALTALAPALKVDVTWFFESSGSLSQQTIPKPVPSPGSGDIIVFPSSGRIPRGKAFVIGHWLPMEELPSPIQARSSGIVTNFYELIFNKLAEATAHGQLRGGLAINWKPVGNSWVFQLREGVRFHNGRPLTAKDVKWSYERHLQQNIQENHVEGVETFNDCFVQIHLKSAYRLEDVPMPFILPSDADETHNQWIGTGPFQPVALNPDFWQLKKNPDYFLANPYFDEIHIRQYPDAQALEQALMEGEVHFAIRVHRSGERFITKAEPAAVRYHLHFMLQEPLAQSRALRQAVALALDLATLARAAGLQSPLYSSGPFDYIRDDRWYTPPPPHPEAAAELLKQVPELQNRVFQVQYSRNVPESRRPAEAIVEQLRAIGIPTEIGDPPHARLLIRPIEPGEPEYTMWLSGHPRNLSGYSNPQVDKFIQAYSDIPATPEQLLELRRLIQKDLPDIPLFYFETPVTYVKHLRALENRMVLLGCLKEIHTWYLDEEEMEADARREEAPRVAAQASA